MESVRGLGRFHRVHGSPGFAAAADWVRDQALKAGLADATVEHFPSDGTTRYAHFRSYLGWDGREGRLDEVSPQARPIARFLELRSLTKWSRHLHSTRSGEATGTRVSSPPAPRAMPSPADVRPVEMGSHHEVFEAAGWSVPMLYSDDWRDVTIHTNKDQPENLDPTKLGRATYLGARIAYTLAALPESEAPKLLALARADAEKDLAQARLRQSLSGVSGAEVFDDRGRAWTMGEDQLNGPCGEENPREPARRAFWFAWYSQFPKTILIRSGSAGRSNRTAVSLQSLDESPRVFPLPAPLCLPLLSLALGALPLFAQTSSARITAITGATPIDGNGGAPAPDAVLILTNDRITAVGPHASVTVPKGATVIDATGRFVVPSYFDTSVSETGAVGQSIRAAPERRRASGRCTPGAGGRARRSLPGAAGGLNPRHARGSATRGGIRGFPSACDAASWPKDFRQRVKGNLSIPSRPFFHRPSLPCDGTIPRGQEARATSGANWRSVVS